MLEEADACPEQVSLFRELFGEGGVVTLSRCETAVKAGLDLRWAAERFLSADALAKFEKAWPAVWSQYRKAWGGIWAKDGNASLAKYEKAMDRLWAKYEKAMVNVFFAAWTANKP